MRSHFRSAMYGSTPHFRVAPIGEVSLSMVSEKILLLRKAIGFFHIYVQVNIRRAFAINTSYLLLFFVCSDRELALTDVNWDPVSL